MLSTQLILTFAILTFAVAIFLTDGKLFLAQLILSLGYIFTTNLLIGVLQIVFLVFVLYRCKKAIDYDFHLVLEKTHQIPKNLTKDGRIGGDFSLFRKQY
ncbi:hypothetical protein [Ammoniphilus resinae]|uniref:Uncharacterized protein n=1 Tax=Ammoniphilus resinae TaxID=861532 RepID=A0ABS4GL85_9BACL|nr:hypothetical protein [Ammoniphilus resinae]MBP1931020.1 hypothetical protein [Ammoniphilus resinae]